MESARRASDATNQAIASGDFEIALRQCVDCCRLLERVFEPVPGWPLPLLQRTILAKLQVYFGLFAEARASLQACFPALRKIYPCDSEVLRECERLFAQVEANLFEA